MKKTSEWRLQQCRTNQRRYRRQAQEGMRNLEEEVATLNVETARLEGNLHILRATSLHQSIGARVITQYAQTFRYGLTNEAKQLHYLQSIMSHDVTVLGQQDGYNTMVTQWRRYSTYFESIEIVQTDMDVIRLDTAELVHCHGYLRLRINRRTLETIFPAILVREDLVQRLIGQEIQVNYSTDYSVHLEDGRIFEMEGSVVFLNAIMDLLKNTDDAVQIMEDSLVDSWGFLPPHSNQV